jgi:outer membrane receptor protein involved in Fe transport
MRFILAWSGALALLLMAAIPAVADVNGLVHGHVTVNGTARAGVSVTVNGENTTERTTTDANGNFTFTRIPFGRYTVTAQAADLPAASTTIVVSTDSINDVSLSVGALREIGRTVTALRTVSGTPVSQNTITQSQIAASPQGQSLNSLVETVPGIVHFSYNEPVAHGFHGLTYEIDGAPLPLSTSSNFSEIVDPRNIDSLEIFTGAFPAEFGGSRMGAVVNIITKRDADIPSGVQSLVTAGAGTTNGTQFGSLDESIKSGATTFFLDANASRTARGLDSPTQVPLNDNASLSDYFFRSNTSLSAHDTLSLDLSNQYNAFQIPINTVLNPANPNNPIVNPAGTDDVQLEYDSFANLNFTHTSADGNGYFQIIPWWRFTRIVYNGDLANDVLALDYSPSDCGTTDNFPTASPCSLAGLVQDRGATYEGVRSAYFRTFGQHAIKGGVEGSVENFKSAETIAQLGQPNFFDNVAQRGTAFSAYVEDNWKPASFFSVQAGLRYDRSAGFTSGNELQPRIGANVEIAPATIFHAYYGRIYAAPGLEDTRREAVVIGGGSPASALPVYDLQPEHDSYYEAGLAHTFAGGIDGYVNVWKRNAWNVLDTTQIFPTPIFAVFNNALGLAHGYELRLEQNVRTASWYLSGTWSQSVAGGISGGTFLFPPDAVSDTSLNPEDHDQSVAIEGAYTKRFAPDLRSYVTLGTAYGTGYPVQFQNGPGRLPPHLTFDAAIGREPQAHSLGYKLSATNFTNYSYLLKVANGFNTTQWASGAQVNFALEAAF